MTGGRGGGGLWSDDVIQNRSISLRDFLYLKKLLAVSVYCDNVEI